MFHYAISLFLISLLLAPSVYAQSAEMPVQVLRQNEKMGDYDISWTLYGPSNKALKATAATLKQELQTQVAHLYQLKKDRSDTSVSQEVYQLLAQLQTACEQSQSALNPLDVSLRENWGFTPQSLSYRVPTPDQRQELTKNLECSGIKTTQKPLSTEYFGAGWLIDQTRSLLNITSQNSLSASRIQINEVAFYQGQPPQAKAWKVPVYHPRQQDALIQYFYLDNKALVTLGDATHHFYANGLRYPDFIDARTGKSHAEYAGAYVLSDSALQAQLLARTSVLLEPEELKTLVKQQSMLRLILWKEQLGRLVPVEFASP